MAPAAVTAVTLIASVPCAGARKVSSVWRPSQLTSGRLSPLRFHRSDATAPAVCTLIVDIRPARIGPTGLMSVTIGRLVTGVVTV